MLQDITARSFGPDKRLRAAPPRLTWSIGYESERPLPPVPLDHLPHVPVQKVAAVCVIVERIPVLDEPAGLVVQRAVGEGPKVAVQVLLPAGGVRLRGTVVDGNHGVAQRRAEDEEGQEVLVVVQDICKPRCYLTELFRVFFRRTPTAKSFTWIARILKAASLNSKNCPFGIRARSHGS